MWFLSFLFIPFICFGFSCQEFMYAILNASAWMNKNQSYFYDHFSKMNYKKNSVPVNVYSIINNQGEAVDDDSVVVMKKIDDKLLFAQFSSAPLNLESGFRNKIRTRKQKDEIKNTSVKTAEKSIQTPPIEENLISSKFRFIDPNHNEFRCVLFKENFCREFDDKILAESKKIKDSNTVKWLNKYMSEATIKDKKISPQTMSGLQSAICSTEKNPQIIFFEAAELKNKKALYKMPLKQFNLLCLYYKNKHS